MQQSCWKLINCCVFLSVSVRQSAEDGCFKIDLKGVLYQATVLPLAGTALVVNMGPTDAKVTWDCLWGNPGSAERCPVTWQMSLIQVLSYDVSDILHGELPVLAGLNKSKSSRFQQVHAARRRLL
jgi:hypothetical protein